MLGCVHEQKVWLLSTRQEWVYQSESSLAALLAMAPGEDATGMHLWTITTPEHHPFALTSQATIVYTSI